MNVISKDNTNRRNVLKILSPKTKILLVILIFIGFQQFPVLHIGGSLKIYEIFGLYLLFSYGIRCKRDKLTSLLFMFFVVSPIISLISFYILDDVSSYFVTYPMAKDKFRYNIYVFPILQLLFMFANYVVLFNLYFNKDIYRRFDDVIKWIVIIGTIVACYSVVAMFTGDPIAHLPSFLQNKHIYEFRSSGFSQEPSNYILYQGWIVLLCWYSKEIFGFGRWLLLFSINIMSLLLTFSSTLVLFVGVIVLMIFVFSRLTKKFVYIGILVSVLWMGYVMLSKYMDTEMLNYAMVQKVEDFVSGQDDAGGSGGFRHYESSLGWIIFQDNPILGVGVGNSNYFMHIADKKSPIIPLDEQLNETSFPPNTIVCVFAEQGVLGGVF